MYSASVLESAIEWLMSLRIAEYQAGSSAGGASMTSGIVSARDKSYR